MSAVGMMPAASDSRVQGIRLGIPPGIPPDIHPSGLACTLACARTSTRMGDRLAVRPGIQPDIESISCPKGLSAAQINTIGLLRLFGSTITQYAQLALALNQHYSMLRTPGAVRKIVERLTERGFIRHRQMREGTLHGVSFCLIEDRLCPHIQAPVRPGIPPDVLAGEFAALSIQEEIDRKNLSISSGNAQGNREKLETLDEEDIAFHWPELTNYGFGTAQIRQIVSRREQVGEDVSHVMQGLTYAEWELAHQCMKDAKGKAVDAPLNWVFRILATQGYYPRPSGYVSPAELAERDRKETLKREQEAREARFAAEAETWAATLTPDEREAVLGSKGSASASIPEAVRLRLHFKAEIWPEMLKHEKETP